MYAKYFNRDGLYTADDHSAFDDWQAVRGGFRSDWDLAPDQLLTVQGDYYSMHSEHVFNHIVYAPPCA